MSNVNWSLTGFSSLLAQAAPAAGKAASSTTSVDVNDPNAKLFGCSDGCGQLYSQAEIDAAMAWTPEKKQQTSTQAAGAAT